MITIAAFLLFGFLVLLLISFVYFCEWVLSRREITS